jgi:DNA-binding transcriptional ArsR family regulator
MPVPGVPVAAMTLLDGPDRARLALSPLRRRLLERLQEPASATQVAAELGLPRQRVNHHVRALERAGLLELVEERPRRGCVERILAATADAFVVDPAMIGGSGAASRQDRFAAEHRAPRDLERFTTALAERVATTVAEFDARGGRPYRVVAGGHPAPPIEREAS